MALFWLCGVGAQDPALWPRASPASLVVPEEHPEKPQNAGQLSWKTNHLILLLVSYTRKQVQRGYMRSPGSTTVSTCGRARTTTQVSYHPIQHGSSIIP